MQTVLLTPTFESEARRAGLTDDEVLHIASVIAADPLAGELIPGTGGARKLRFARRGAGKSGGYRTVHYFAGLDVPIFLLAVYGKGEKANLTQAERNALAALLPRIAANWRSRRRRD
jgi:hypothetical protein